MSAPAYQWKPSEAEVDAALSNSASASEALSSVWASSPGPELAEALAQIRRELNSGYRITPGKVQTITRILSRLGGEGGKS